MFRQVFAKLGAVAVMLACVGAVWGQGAQMEPGPGSDPAAEPEKVECPLWGDTTVTDDPSDPTPAKPTPTPTPGPTTPSEPTTTPTKTTKSQMTGTNSNYLHSGEHYVAVTDLRVPAQGPDFIWARKYRSRLGPTTAMGYGWDFSYNVYLEQYGLDLLLHDGNTREDLYYFNGIDAWHAPQFFREIIQNADLTYTVSFPNRGMWNFYPFDSSPVQGKLMNIVDRNGNSIDFVYNPSGQLAGVVDALGRPYTIAYNLDGFIESVTDFSGRVVTYEYYGIEEEGGSFGDLKAVTTPAVTGTPNGNDFPSGKRTVYTYTQGFGDPSLNHDLLTVTDPKGQTYLSNAYAHTIDPNDPRYTIDPIDFHYDRIVRQIWGDPGDTVDIYYVPQVVDPNNNFAVVKAIVNDRVGNVKEFYYDDKSRVVISQEYTGRAPDPQAVTTEVDNRPIGKLRVTDPDYFEKRFEYNTDSLVTRIIYPNLNEETFTYDEFNLDRRMQGNILEHCWLPGPLGGDQIQICESFLYESGFGGCCGGNFVTWHMDFRGNVTQHSYDGNGNRTQTIHRDSGLENWEYDGNGQMTAHVWPDNGDGHRRRDEYTYYSAGPQSGYLHETIVDVGGFELTTTYEYDSVGNIIRFVDARGHDTLYDINQLNQVVRERSREVEEGGGVRYETLYYYDENDKLVQIDVQNLDETGAIQPNAYFTTTYEYDSLNRLARITDEVDVGHSVITEYEYDANRNRSLVRYGEATAGIDPTNVVAFLHDERDLLYQDTRGAGSADQSTTQYDYDGNGNPVRISQGLEDTPRITEYAYDGYDRLVTITDPMGNTTTYHYDANGNQVSSRVDGELVDMPGSAGNVRLSEATHIYDAMNHLEQRDVAHFDPVTQLPIGDGLATTLTDYSNNSQVVVTVDDNGHTTTYTYDTVNRKSAVTDAEGNCLTYTYDENSNVVTMAQDEKSDLDPNAAEIYYTNYTYDGLDRRIRTENNISSAWDSGYNSRGNLVLEIDASTYENRYTYEGLDRRIETVYDMDGDGADGDGADIVLTQAYDDSSRLISETRRSRERHAILV